MLQAEHSVVTQVAIIESMARVLVVDGDPAERMKLSTVVTAAGHQVEAAATAQSGLLLARAATPALVLIDAGLPDGSAASVVRALRAEASTAGVLIFVLSEGGEEERIEAFEAGADDLVRKPFSTREITLRVSALLRRKRPSAQVTRVLTVGPIRIDAAARRVSIGDGQLALTRREFDLLHLLATGRGRVHSRETIVGRLWPNDVDSGRVVDTTVKRLRKKLGTMSRAIQTVRGAGYRLAVED